MILSSAGLSLIDILWCFLTSCFLVAFCAHKISTHVPRRCETSRVYVLFQDLIRYGKTKQNIRRDDWLLLFDVPKRWFWHFYAISVGWNSFLLVLYLKFIHQPQSFPSWLNGILDTLAGAASTNNHVPQLSTALVQLLLCLHSLRRLQECLLVSVFSDGVMHVVQYVFGLGYYVVLGLTVLCSDRAGKGTGALLSQFDWIHVVGLLLFVGASFLQHQSMVLLARLRTGKSGPLSGLYFWNSGDPGSQGARGGLFELVSCPHYLAELLIYVSLSLVFGGLSLTWWLVVLYVFFNQALAGQLCHDLYTSKYESYPKHRKAFIPFLL